MTILPLDPKQVGPHGSAHVEGGAVQRCVGSALQRRDPAADHNFGEHRVRGHRDPGTDLEGRQH